MLGPRELRILPRSLSGRTLQGIEAVQVSPSHGADPYTASARGMANKWRQLLPAQPDRPLYCDGRPAPIFRHLLKHGADPNLQCSEGKTSLWLAVAFEALPIIILA